MYGKRIRETNKAMIHHIIIRVHTLSCNIPAFSSTLNFFVKKTSTRIWAGIALALLILVLLSFSLLHISKSIYHKDSKTTNFSKKNMNSFNIKKYDFKNKSNQALIYDVNSTSKVIVLKGFPSVKSDLSQDMRIFLKDVFHGKVFNLERVSSVQIYGHTDLQYYENNNLLGKERALKVKEIISLYIDKSKIEIKYNPDFFMRDTDKLLNKTLLKVLNLNDEVLKLAQTLNISNKVSIEETRNRFKDIDLSEYSERLKSFRSVIIVVKLFNG